MNFFLELDEKRKGVQSPQRGDLSQAETLYLDQITELAQYDDLERLAVL